jgi:hypothetical protein
VWQVRVRNCRPSTHRRTRLARPRSRRKRSTGAPSRHRDGRPVMLDASLPPLHEDHPPQYVLQRPLQGARRAAARTVEQSASACPTGTAQRAIVDGCDRRGLDGRSGSRAPAAVARPTIGRGHSATSYLHGLILRLGVKGQHATHRGVGDQSERQALRATVGTGAPSTEHLRGRPTTRRPVVASSDYAQPPTVLIWDAQTEPHPKLRSRTALTPRH